MRGKDLLRDLLDVTLLAGFIAPAQIALLQPVAAAQERQAVQEPQEVRLDFEDTDIRAVISALAELMGVNVTYGSLPSRTVTLKTNQPVPRDSLRAIFTTLLESNGLRVEESGGVLRILQVEEPTRGQQEPRAAPAGELGLYVIRLRHAHASEAAASINALFGHAPAGLGRGPSLSGAGLAGGLRESLVPPGLPEEPTPRAVPGQVEAPAGGRRSQVQQAQFEAEVTIVPDLSTNALLVRATPHHFEIIQAVVELLDVRPSQVMIEVLVAEARRDALTQIGLEVFVSNEPSGDDPQVEGELSERVLGNLVARIMHLDGVQVDALVEALSTSSDVRILSRPVLVTANNQEAQILVGSERPFIQVSRALPTDAAVRDQIIQLRDVGTKLTILPTINADRYVTLTLRQEVSAATAETQFGAPVISSRETSTRLLVKDGRTVVIGGLIDRQRERIRSGVPLLKDLPILGALFGSTSWRATETELFLFLTPHVIDTDEEAERARESVEQAAPRIRERLPLPRIPPDTMANDTTGRGGARVPGIGKGLPQPPVGPDTARADTASASGTGSAVP